MVNYSPKEVLAKDQFFSICIPYFNRIHYLKRLLESFEQYADMPYEIIIHDDGSDDGSSEELFKMRDKYSTLIVNGYKNLGLATSLNRCVEMASSKYIFFLNSDCGLARPCLKMYKEMLDKPYVGAILPGHGTGPDPEHAKLEGTWYMAGDYRFRLGVGGGTSMIVFRKDLWQEIGKFKEDLHIAASDIAMLNKIIRAGYFPAQQYDIIDTALPTCVNYSHAELANSDSTIRGGLDNAYPPIFKGILSTEDLSEKKKQLVDRAAHASESTPEAVHNFHYWVAYIKSLQTRGEINWDAAAKYSLDRWKDQVEADKIVSEVT